MSLKSLDDLSRENETVLFDTSVLSGYLEKNNGDFNFETIGEKATYKKNCNNFLIKFLEYLPDGQRFFVTFPIWNELGNFSSYNFKKNVKKNGSHKNDDLLKLRRIIKEQHQVKRKVIDSLAENHKILFPEGNIKEEYDALAEKYRNIQTDYFLSDADFDFLLTGMSMAKKSFPVIFVSNDLGIFHARNEMLRDAYLSEREARFFMRKETWLFKRLFPDFNYKKERLVTHP